MLGFVFVGSLIVFLESSDYVGLGVVLIFLFLGVVFFFSCLVSLFFKRFVGGGWCFVLVIVCNVVFFFWMWFVDM